MKNILTAIHNLKHSALVVIVSLAFFDDPVCHDALYAATPVQTASTASAKGQPIPRNCLEQSKFLDENLQTHPRPDDWTYVIVCDNAAWTALQGHLTTDDLEQTLDPESVMDKKRHVSYFHASQYLEPASLLRLISTSLLLSDLDRNRLHKAIAPDNRNPTGK
ncbi:hypothetical protein [Granulicella sp. dw_53]|uniref:hypothetical protein n=1 Tax=Granulicella sp. dw_53 TaxID=2719792 RepID=UPI001BD236DF|nr:hypothetical protein [Granulicella sp. dw_53]